MTEVKKEEKLDFQTVTDLNSKDLSEDLAIELMLDNENYHIANILGMSISDKDNNYFIKKDNVITILNKIKDKNIIN